MTISTTTPVRLNECLTTPAHVAATAVGPIQYAERGHGPAALSVHGTPGGYDQALLARTSTLSAPARARQAQRIAGDPDRVALMSALTATNSRQAAQRQAGLRNDYAQFADIGQLPLAGITCPTLIVHGTADKDVTTTNATYAHASIPTSELHWIPDGSHFGFGVNDDAQMHQEYVLNWLLAHRNQ